MSPCIEDNTLIRLVAGELAPAERERVSAHLAGCAACRQRYDEITATWLVLGSWNPHVPERDLSTAVLRAAQHHNVPMPWLRIAASVVLAAGLGSGVGFLVSSRPQQTVPPQSVSTQELAQKLGLDAMSGESSGLGDLFAGGSEDPEREEGQS